MPPTRVLTAATARRPRSSSPSGRRPTRRHVREALAAGASRRWSASAATARSRGIADRARRHRRPAGHPARRDRQLLAGVLGVPPAKQAAAALGDAPATAIDLGEVRIEHHGPRPGDATHHGPSAIGCGLGFDARLMSTTHRGHKARLGRYRLPVPGRPLARTIGTVPYHIIIDGRVIEVEASIAMVTNMGDLLPGVSGPGSRHLPDDGLLDVFVLGARQRSRASAASPTSCGAATTGRRCRLGHAAAPVPLGAPRVHAARAHPGGRRSVRVGALEADGPTRRPPAGAARPSRRGRHGVPDAHPRQIGPRRYGDVPGHRGSAPCSRRP